MPKGESSIQFFARSKWGGVILSLLAGCLVALAFPDRNIWWAAGVGYLPLLAALHVQQSRRSAFFRGWLAGVALHAGCYYWVYHTMISMSSLSPGLAAICLVLFCAYSGLQLGLFGVIVPWIRRHSGSHALWMIPVWFTGVEYAFPHVFPWYLGNALYEALLFAQTADLWGVHGLGMGLMVCNILLHDSAVTSASRVGLNRKSALIALITLIALAGFYGQWRISSIVDAEPIRTHRIGLAQSNVTPEDKKRKGADRAIIFEKGLKRMSELESADVDLIVWPEGGYPYYFPTGMLTEEARVKKTVGPGYAGRLQKMVQQRGVPFFFGALTKPQPPRKLQNAMIQLAPDGSFEEVHFKRILVPFGEYIPFSDWFPFVKGKVKGIGDMEPGTERVVFRLGETVVLPSICYEAIYPAATRKFVMEEPRAQAIVNITNDMWFGDTSALGMHLMVQTMRTIELRIPLVRATNSGITAFIDATGTMTSITPRYEAVSVVDSIAIRDLVSVYSYVGDIPLGCAMALLIVVGWRRGRTHRQMDAA